MKSKQIFFFATEDDLLEIIKFLELTYDIKYAEGGLLDKKLNCNLSLISSIQNYSIKYGDWNFNKMYIILPKNKDLIIREIIQKQGDIKYAVDQMKNEESIVIYLGGRYNEEAIIASKIGTIYQNEFTSNIMKGLSNYFRKNFKNIKGFYLSTKVISESKQGVRLTTNIKNSIEYDLNIEN